MSKVTPLGGCEELTLLTRMILHKRNTLMRFEMKFCLHSKVESQNIYEFSGS